MSIPSRRKRGSAGTRRKTYKSPAGPPLGPASPSPRTRSLLPSSTPGGILILICLLRFCTPFPSHPPQYFSTTLPAPPQVGHRTCCCILPRMVFTTCVVTPLPPHVPQVLTEAPGATPLPVHVPHVSRCVIRIFFCPPKRAVEKSTSMSKRRSSPCVGPRRRAPPPACPPKNDSKISPRSKSCIPGPGPPPPPAPRTPATPNWSYRARISGLESTWYASLIDWNFSFAPGSWFTSGCHLRAACRYAFLISFSDACRATPSSW
mmetsp:Transcript_34007/g.84756  ORF Transcript_34007/g.84756 Transcript_34007/m.84756 type:complete len:262 (+) Transcript_34007:766-1551(+)